MLFYLEQILFVLLFSESYYKHFVVGLPAWNIYHFISLFIQFFQIKLSMGMGLFIYVTYNLRNI